MTKNLLIIGDSISNGYGVTAAQAYPQLLQARYISDGNPVVIQNSSYNGAQTDTLNQIVVTALTGINKPNFALILLGINDAFNDVPGPTLNANFFFSMQKLQFAGVPMLLGGVDLSTLKPTYAATLVDAYVYVLDNLTGITPDVLMTEDIIQNYTIDGIHPNATGHQMIYENAYAELALMGI